MKKKLVKYGKILLAITLIGALALPSYATVGASDGSAFVTKAEFDAALSDFNARLTTFEAGINSKIDSQVSSYLDRNGIWNGKEQEISNEFYNGGAWFSLDHWGYGPGEDKYALVWNTDDVRRADKKLYYVGRQANADDVISTGYNLKAVEYDKSQQAYTKYRWIVPSTTPTYNTKDFISSINKSGLLMFKLAIRADYIYTERQERASNDGTGNRPWGIFWNFHKNHWNDKIPIPNTGITIDDLQKCTGADDVGGFNLVGGIMEEHAATGYRNGGIAISFELGKVKSGGFVSNQSFNAFDIRWPSNQTCQASNGVTFLQCPVSTQVYSAMIFVTRGDCLKIRGVINTYGRTFNQNICLMLDGNSDFNYTDPNGGGTANNGYWRALVLTDQKPQVY